MSRWFTSLAVAGSAALLSACVYYPHGPYGPGYGPYHSGYDQPPPGGGDYGPPPQNNYPPPPPPRQQQGYAPQGQYSQPQGQYGQPQGPGEDGGGPPDSESQGPTQKQLAHMNDPAWCSSHQRKCEKLQSRFGQGPGREQGPPPEQGPPEGPPPGQS